MTENRDDAFFMRNVLCFSSPGRGDFRTGEVSRAVSAPVESLKVNGCCFGGVPTNPSALSVDTNHSVLIPKKGLGCQIILFTCSTSMCCLKDEATTN